MSWLSSSNKLATFLCYQLENFGMSKCDTEHSVLSLGKIIQFSVRLSFEVLISLRFFDIYFIFFALFLPFEIAQCKICFVQQNTWLPTAR